MIINKSYGDVGAEKPERVAFTPVIIHKLLHLHQKPLSEVEL
jgi:hypothetical protein